MTFIFNAEKSNVNFYCYFPGSKKGSSECLGFISTSLPHALDVLNDRKDKVEKTHHDLQNGSSTSSSSGLVSRDHVCPHNQPMVTNGESKVRQKAFFNFPLAHFSIRESFTLTCSYRLTPARLRVAIASLHSL